LRILRPGHDLAVGEPDELALERHRRVPVHDLMSEKFVAS
jgi:hypothetical protein